MTGRMTGSPQAGQVTMSSSSRSAAAASDIDAALPESWLCVKRSLEVRQASPRRVLASNAGA